MATKEAVTWAPTRPLTPEEEAHAEEVRTALERALNSRRIVLLLTAELGFSDEAIARMTSVHEGSVRRWRSKDPEVGEPRPPQAKAIERIRAVASHFLEHGALKDLKGIGAWFEQMNRGLDMEAPAEQPMTAERYEAVMRLARQFTKPGAGMAAYGPPGR